MSNTNSMYLHGSYIYPNTIITIFTHTRHQFGDKNFIGHKIVGHPAPRPKHALHGFPRKETCPAYHV